MQSWFGWHLSVVYSFYMSLRLRCVIQLRKDPMCYMSLHGICKAIAQQCCGDACVQFFHSIFLPLHSSPLPVVCTVIHVHCFVNLPLAE